MLLIIDNYDSFVYNLSRYCFELGYQNIRIIRHDAITPDEIACLQPQAIILSPGPGTPEQAGICLQIIASFSGKIPILGICLGHQVIAQYFGAEVFQTNKPVHGRSDIIYHDQKGIFSDIPLPFKAGRYHSLSVKDLKLPLVKTAWLQDNTIMGIQHKIHLTIGLQFHPESILTEYGHRILQNFLEQL